MSRAGSAFPSFLSPMASSTRRSHLRVERRSSQMSSHGGMQLEGGSGEADADRRAGGVRPGSSGPSPRSTMSPTAVVVRGSPPGNVPRSNGVAFGGYPPGELLGHLVSMGRGNPLFAVWGKDLVRSWATELPVGERIAFQGTEGVAEFLRGVADGMCGMHRPIGRGLTSDSAGAARRIVNA